jgi:transposase
VAYRKIDRDTERRIVLAALSGDTHACVADQYGVHRVTVSRLVSRAKREAHKEAKFYTAVCGKMARQEVRRWQARDDR